MAQAEPAATQRDAYDTFLEIYPSYRETQRIDELRAREFARLDEQGHVYLDYTGGGLYATSQVRQHGELLMGAVLGNPHSDSLAALRSTDLIEACRRHVLRFFNASPDEYVLIFTANATHALKLVGEAYPFVPESRLLLTFDNHNSVNGIREFGRVRGARTVYIPVLPPDLGADDSRVEELLSRGPDGPRLFVYPAQSNFSGVQHPLEWIATARSHGWHVLLDAAAFVPTNRLDLSRWRPDFVALSFYKMFGYPTGVGALIARSDALVKLRRPWFSGGTITVASVQGDQYYLAAGAAAFEDGTLDYANIPAVDIGLTLLESVGLEPLHERVRCLTAWLIDQFQALRHLNGRRLVTLYGPTTTKGRGGTVAFNVHEPRGGVIPHREVDARAAEHRISLRTGCFCNPGAGEVALGLTEAELRRCLREPAARMTKDDFWRCIDTQNTGAVRVSLGLASNFADVYRFIRFMRGFLN